MSIETKITWAFAHATVGTPLFRKKSVPPSWQRMHSVGATETSCFASYEDSRIARA